jgi:hypothetical protein
VPTLASSIAQSVALAREIAALCVGERTLAGRLEAVHIAQLRHGIERVIALELGQHARVDIEIEFVDRHRDVGIHDFLPIDPRVALWIEDREFENVAVGGGVEPFFEVRPPRRKHFLGEIDAPQMRNTRLNAWLVFVP